jgi:hypothetical protein
MVDFLLSKGAEIEAVAGDGDVLDDFAGAVEDAQVQPPCVQIHAGVESVLTVVEAHHGHGLPGVGAGLIPLLCWDAR